MLRGRLLLAAVLAAASLAVLPAVGRAEARWPVVGFGEQRASVFANPHWQALKLPHARLVVGWDALRYGWQRAEIDAWMREARRVRAKPVVSFTRSRAHWRRRLVPTTGQYRRWFLRFRKRYPDVKTFIPWNEANHCSQPICHRPRRAARYFETMKGECRSCTVVAADVLDSPGMEAWLVAFLRAVRIKPRLWGLHNYLDANRFRTAGTRAMLRTVKGRIWFTETGGIVERKGSSPYHFSESAPHAARATHWVLRRLTRLSPRIRRVYLYHFEHPGQDAGWDSGVLDHRGVPRPAYRVVRRWAARATRARRAGR